MLSTSNPVPPFHLQNTPRYCGAACTQMVLAAINQSHLSTSQRILFQGTSTSAFSSTTEAGMFWDSYPDGIVNTLNARSGEATAFVLHVCASEPELAQLLVETLKQGNKAPIVLVLGQSHWVVVAAIDWIAGDGGPIVLNYYIHDPQAIIGDPDFPHSPADPCGSGGGLGTPMHQVSAAGWASAWATGVSGPSRWDRKFLAICMSSAVPNDGEFHERSAALALAASPADAAEDDIQEIVAPAIAAPPTLDEPEAVAVAPVLPPERIAELATIWLRESSLVNDALWAAAFTTSGPMTPILVERLDRVGSDYYIVPFGLSDEATADEGRGPTERRVPLAAIFDAYIGDYHESIALPEGTLYEIAWLELDGITSRSQAAGVELERTAQPDQRFPFRLVWRPAEESRSRFWPFLVKAGDTGGYVRLDGLEIQELRDARA